MRQLTTAISVIFALSLVGCAESLNNSQEPTQLEESNDDGSSVSGKADKIADQMADQINVPTGDEASFHFIEITSVNEDQNKKKGTAIDLKKNTITIIDGSGEQSFELELNHRKTLIREVFNTEFRFEFDNGFNCATREIESGFFTKLVTKPMDEKYSRDGSDKVKHTSPNKNITGCLLGEPDTEDERLVQGASDLLLSIRQEYTSK